VIRVSTELTELMVHRALRESREFLEQREPQDRKAFKVRKESKAIPETLGLKDFRDRKVIPDCKESKVSKATLAISARRDRKVCKAIPERPHGPESLTSPRHSRHQHTRMPRPTSRAPQSWMLMLDSPTHELRLLTHMLHPRSLAQRSSHLTLG